MKVINIHKRIIDQPKEKIVELFKTLSTKNDRIWPTENWPPMRFKEGLKVDSRGGHGPIKYTIKKYNSEEFIEFEFSKPIGFKGIHRLEIVKLDQEITEISHLIKMKTTGLATLYWLFAIRWLHDALLEDAFDKVENHFLTKKKRTNWNFGVKLLRKMLAR